MPLMGSLVHWTQLRRESELEPAINRILKPESKRIKTGKKKKTEYPRVWDIYKGMIYT